jgi:Heterokaryon incompatibility protein (HET)
MVNPHETENDEHSLNYLDDNSKLCSICENINLHPAYFQSAVLRGKGIDLGNIDDIELRSIHCTLCSMVQRVVFQTQENNKILIRRGVDSNLQLTPMWDGRIQVIGSNHGFGEILLREQDFFSIHPDMSPEYTNLSRVLKERQVDISLIRSWIRDCDQGHNKLGDCDKWGLSSKIKYPKDLTLIEVNSVGTGKLVRPCGEERYLALSYVWGNVPMLRMTKDYRSSLERDNALQLHVNELPKVIKDAMELVRLLGERYLWVDSLCIVQDDDDSMHQQIQQMGAIYSAAYITIVAIAGNNAHVGLPGVSLGSRSCQSDSVKINGLRYSARLPSLWHVLNESKYAGA